MDVDDAIHEEVEQGTHQQQQLQLDPNQLILMLQQQMQQETYRQQFAQQQQQQR